MKFLIEIDCAGASFYDDRNAEIANHLSEIAHTLRHLSPDKIQGQVDGQTMMRLLDSRGAVVGMAYGVEPETIPPEE